MEFDPISVYIDYLNTYVPLLDREDIEDILLGIERCNWENPQTARDYTQLGIAALVEAEIADTDAGRGLFLETALSALQTSAEMGEDWLGTVHLSLLYALLGNFRDATDLAYSTLLEVFHPMWTIADRPRGMVYLPPTNDRPEYLERALLANSAEWQAAIILTAVLSLTQVSIDTTANIRLLHLASRLMPEAVTPHFKLGIYGMGIGDLESIFYLHRAQANSPDAPYLLQSLYLAYRDLNRPDLAAYWHEYATKLGSETSERMEWQWISLPPTAAKTFVPFVTGNCVAVPATIQDKIGRTLLAEGNWPEAELDWWYAYLPKGGSAIDIGAHVGVYSWVAASRVGDRGKVLAIEPDSLLVECLQATHSTGCHIEIEGVALGAKSGTAALQINTDRALNCLLDASALMESDDPDLVRVTVATLDEIVAAAGFDRLDAIKLTTNGSELDILQGGEVTIATYHPAILYAGETEQHPTNLAIGTWLRDRGYAIYRYRPFSRDLLPIGETYSAAALKLIALFIDG
jgi:FkbM family methyltransferase